MSIPRALDGLRASIAVLTVIPVPPGPLRPRSVLVFAPLVGVLLAAVVAGIVTGGQLLFDGAGGAPLVAVLTIASLALLTRGLHLDGLADTADGLGAFGSGESSLRVMRRSDIGPFGVATLVFVLLVDAAALARDIDVGRGPVSVFVAVICGRVAMVHAGVRGIPPARPDGLGAQVAGSVPGPVAWLSTVVLLMVTLGPACFGHLGLTGRLAAGVILGCLAAGMLRGRAVRRFGGITGDVLGALSELATCTVLVVSAIR